MNPAFVPHVDTVHFYNLKFKDKVLSSNGNFSLNSDNVSISSSQPGSTSNSPPFAHISSSDWVILNKNLLTKFAKIFMTDKNQTLDTHTPVYENINTTSYQASENLFPYQEATFTDSTPENNENVCFQGIEPERVYTGEYTPPPSVVESSAIFAIQVLFIYTIGGTLFDLTPKLLKKYLFPRVSFLRFLSYEEEKGKKESKIDFKSILNIFYKFDNNQITKEEALFILRNEYNYSFNSAIDLLENSKSREVLQPIFDQDFEFKFKEKKYRK